MLRRVQQITRGEWSRFRAWQARNRLEALRVKFSELERACFDAGEDELANIVAMAWVSRKRGHTTSALLALMFRQHTNFGALDPRERGSESHV